MIGHWNEGPVCRFCDAALGWYAGRAAPERCSPCMVENPSKFGEPLPSSSFAVELDRQARVDVCAKWWASRPESSDVRRAVARVARLVDRNEFAEGRRPFETFAEAEVGGVDVRLELAAFIDRFGGDLELLVASYCRGHRAKGEAPRPRRD